MKIAIKTITSLSGDIEYIPNELIIISFPLLFLFISIFNTKGLHVFLKMSGFLYINFQF